MSFFLNGSFKLEANEQSHGILSKFRMVLIWLAFLPIPTLSQGVYDGYVLWDAGSTVYLLNTSKDVVHTWNDLRFNPYGVYLNEKGNLVRPCESDSVGIEFMVAFGALQEIDKFGNIVWETNYKNDSVVYHHDIALMPNGNILVIAYERKPVGDAQQQGFDTEYDILAEQILEVKPPSAENPAGEIVWKWHIWDHLTTGDEAHLFNVDMGTRNSFPPSDGYIEWVHMNGIDFNAALDQIIFSSRYFNEIYIIDHSTTTSEAAGHTGGKSGMGGDILFRWGNPGNYGSTGKSWIANAVHCPTWIPAGYPGAGNITAFINSMTEETEEEEGRPGGRNSTFSSGNSAVYEIAPKLKGAFNYESGESLEPVWRFTDISSKFMSGVQRLPNGNTFICEATASRFLEVSPSGEVLWEYSVNQKRDEGGALPGFNNITPRAHKYGADHPGILLLLDPTSVKKPSGHTEKSEVAPTLNFDGRALWISGLIGKGRLGIYHVSGKMVSSFEISRGRDEIDLNMLEQGVYILKFSTGNFVQEKIVYKSH